MGCELWVLNSEAYLQDYRKLRVWEKAHELVMSVYDETRSFPKAEMFALRRQIREAAASVPGNMAEGCGRRSNAQLIQSLYVSSGSLSELDYFLFLSNARNYFAAGSYDALLRQLVEVRRMLIGLLRSLGGLNS